MTWTLVILCVAIVALVAFGASLATGLALAIAGRRLDKLAPSAQARIYLVASMLPALAAGLVLLAALAPSFGLVADHCGATPNIHSHPHVCADHPVTTWPAIPLIVLASLVAARCFYAVGRRLLAWRLSCRHSRALSLGSSAHEAESVRVLPIRDEAQAFVIGLFRPVVFVTEALATGAARDHLAAVLAHERAHIRRRDPLRRFVAGIGLAFHVPGIASWIERALSRSQEMAADREAADRVGGASVARALVALAKSRVRVPRKALAFTGASVEARVHRLMDDRIGRDWPSPGAVAAGAAVAVTLVLIGAEAVHHGIETLLGAFGA